MFVRLRIVHRAASDITWRHNQLSLDSENGVIDHSTTLKANIYSEYIEITTLRFWNSCCVFLCVLEISMNWQCSSQ